MVCYRERKKGTGNVFNELGQFNNMLVMPNSLRTGAIVDEEIGGDRLFVTI